MKGIEPNFNSLSKNSEAPERRITIKLVDDSGASCIFVRALGQTIVRDQVPNTSVRVEMPTGVQIKSSHQGHIVLPGLPGVKFLLTFSLLDKV